LENRELDIQAVLIKRLAQKKATQFLLTNGGLITEVLLKTSYNK